MYYFIHFMHFVHFIRYAGEYIYDLRTRLMRYVRDTQSAFLRR